MKCRIGSEWTQVRDHEIEEFKRFLVGAELIEVTSDIFVRLSHVQFSLRLVAA
jgi:hypothetical protein